MFSKACESFGFNKARIFLLHIFIPVVDILKRVIEWLFVAHFLTYFKDFSKSLNSV